MSSLYYIERKKMTNEITMKENKSEKIYRDTDKFLDQLLLKTIFYRINTLIQGIWLFFHMLWLKSITL